MTHQTDHENTADNAAVTPPHALTTEGRLRARVQTLEEDAERNQGLAKVGARCMRDGHQGLIESGRATVEGHRFALSVALGLGTGATWDAIHERVKELRRDSAEPAAVSAAVAPPTQTADEIRDQLLHAIDHAYTTGVLGYTTPEDLLAAYDNSRTPATDQAALRDRIAQAIEDAPYRPDERRSLQLADAVLAVLPEPTDRAAVRAQAFDEAADMLAKLDPVKAALAGEHAWKDAAGLVRHMARQARRMADETATETPEWARPETEDEKLAKARRMAKALSAPPATPSDWAATTEWPNRHKRARDRRVHATAPFEISGVRHFWTACEKPIGEGGYALSHMPVDCRDCKRATAAGARQDGAET